MKEMTMRSDNNNKNKSFENSYENYDFDSLGTLEVS